MIKVIILTVGKNKEQWLIEAIKVYEKRLQAKIQFEFVYLKDERKLAEEIKSKKPIILDATGKQFTSEEFSSFFQRKIEESGSKVYFAIGGAYGFQNADLSNLVKISLSKMTLTHQMVRLLLVEQIYRAKLIQEGSAYHK